MAIASGFAVSLILFFDDGVIFSDILLNRIVGMIRMEQFFFVEFHYFKLVLEGLDHFRSSRPFSPHRRISIG